MSYFHTAGLMGAAALVIAATAGLTRLNKRYGWSLRLCQALGQTAGDWVMRLGFIGVLALVAGGIQKLGVILPPELEQFIPSQVTAMLAAGISAATYWLAPTKPPVAGTHAKDG
jgi:hypothetical protein